MDTPGFRCLSDVLLDRAADNIKNKNFKEAANLIVMVVTDFDEGVNVPDYLERIIKNMGHKEITRLISELSMELEWVCPKPYISKEIRKKMIKFRDEITPLFGDYGWVLNTRKADCSEVADEDSDDRSTFAFTPKQKGKKYHPYS